MGKNRIGYVGTYTKQESRGVYRFELDTDKERIISVELAAELSNPTYVTISKDNSNLYAVSKQDDNGGVAAFSINEKGDLLPLNSQVSAGSPPCHVSVSNDKQNVVTANYHTTKIESYLTNKDGSINPAIASVEHNGSGPHERQDKPHMHYAGFTPDEKFLVAIDLGSDTITTYARDNGKLSKVKELKTNPGSGPRHIAFHPDKKIAYAMTELSSEVIVLSYNEEFGSFTELQYIPAIPEDFDGVNDGSAIHISNDGNFVYAGNRGHNSIAIFRVNQEDGKLTFVDWTSTEGDWPRDFVIDPTGKYIVASNQKSHSLTLFKRDELTGKLHLLQTDVSVPEPVCVKFLN